MAASNGMRRGDVLALRWKDIDFDNGTIRINSAKGEGSTGVKTGENSGCIYTF